MLTTFDLRATDDPQDYLHRTVQTLVEGGIVAVPTESTYRLIAHTKAQSKRCSSTLRDLGNPEK